MGSFWGLLGVSWRLLWCLCGLSAAPLFFKTFLGRPRGTVFYEGFRRVARVRLRNLFILPISVLLLAYYLTLFFQIIIFHMLEPLGVDFELPSGPLTLEKFHFTTGNVTFSIKRGFELIDAIEGALGLSWARFGCPVGLLGGSFAASAASRWLFECSKVLSWAPLSPHPGSRGALPSPRQVHRRPQGEADGPTKPPRPIWTCILTLCPSILKPKSMQTILRIP